MNDLISKKSFLVSAINNTIAAVVLIGTGWMIGNHMAIVSISPEKAAIMIAKKYENPSSGQYTAQLDSDSGKNRVYTVIRNGQQIAKVKISDFMNLGWQEDSYFRL